MDVKVDQLKAKIYANSSMAVVEMKLETWCQVARAAGHSNPFVQSEAMVLDTIASLWAAGYRSIDSYASIVKQKMIEKDGTLWESTRLHFNRALRAAKRGRGPPKQASPLPVERYAELDDSQHEWAPGGPLWPRRLNIVASWWMLREIEAANLTISCASLSGLAATLRLPASKTDQVGLGTSRTLACTCQGRRDPICPMHTLAEQLTWARAFAKQRGKATGSFPLFPSSAASVVSKAAAAATIVQTAVKLGLEIAEENGAEKFTGHSWRVSGAQHLARAGIDIWRIQLHGRWGSAAVLGYVRLASLHPSLAVEATLHRDLSHVREAIVAAKVRLAQLDVGATVAPAQVAKNVIEQELGQALVAGSGLLGSPSMADLLDGAGGKHTVARNPWTAELLVYNSSEAGIAHALRPPKVLPVHLREAEAAGPRVEKHLEQIASRNSTTWCGWNFTWGEKVECVVWTGDISDVGRLCVKCFGEGVARPPDASQSDESSD